MFYSFVFNMCLFSQFLIDTNLNHDSNKSTILWTVLGFQCLGSACNRICLRMLRCCVFTSLAFQSEEAEPEDKTDSRGCIWELWIRKQGFDDALYRRGYGHGIKMKNQRMKGIERQRVFLLSIRSANGYELRGSKEGD